MTLSAPSTLRTLSTDALLAEAADKQYVVGQLSQTPSGLWAIMLWDGPVGYASYAAPAYSATPAVALRAAIDMLDTGNGRILECNIVTPPDIKANLREIMAQHAKPKPPFKIRMV